MFEKILIANRGEIAVRIIRACRELGIKSVAIYSEADKDALHTQLADEAICIGPANSRESYLDITRVISAAVITKSNAIHPGFGFLSENPTFIHACEDSNIILIGPPSQVVEAMGNKSEARKSMIKAGIPVVPGSDGLVTSMEEAKRISKEIGYPMIVKASSGGGGKGMRIINNEDELENNFLMAQKEAKVSFDDDSMYMERYVVNPMHIEFQILADNYGNTIHLGERDCSIQRRHQKIIEEAPSTALSDELREEMGAMAVKVSKAIGYANAGTVEFLLEEDGTYFFMEMNTRIQVEHPITEMITGIDIVKKQIEIASGMHLGLKQEDIVLKGHSIECRINAENPSKGFRPSPGKIEQLHMPGGNGIRVDSAAYGGYTVPPIYDSMIAKLIVHGDTREEAIHKMTSALGEFVVSGIDTNIDFNLELLRQPEFISGAYNTSFIEVVQGRNK